MKNDTNSFPVIILKPFIHQAMQTILTWQLDLLIEVSGKVSSKQYSIDNALKTVVNNSHYFLNIKLNTELAPTYNSVLLCKQYLNIFENFEQCREM